MQRLPHAFAFVALAVFASGCESDRVYECTVGNSSECSRSNQIGDCLAPGFCAFSDSSCEDTGLRWDSTAGDGLAGQCVNANSGGDGGAINACGGTTQLPGIPGQSCGVCGSGSFACDGQEALRCDGEFTLEQNVTSDGTVSASSEFSGSFQAELSVDGDLSTSWFSDGSRTDGAESVYSWISASNRCVSSITFIGNEFHSNSNFRTNFGFGQVTFEVRDESDTVVFSEIRQLPGTPDPQLAVDTAGVIGRTVHLRLQGHESNDCGGFAEMTVNAKL